MTVDKKLDQIASDLVDVRVTLAHNTATLDRNTEDIKNHIKRTDLLQESLTGHVTWKQVVQVGSGIVGLAALAQLALKVLEFFVAKAP